MGPRCTTAARSPVTEGAMDQAHAGDSAVIVAVGVRPSASDECAVYGTNSVTTRAGTDP
jgi:hypothetical protein